MATQSCGISLKLEVHLPGIHIHIPPHKPPQLFPILRHSPCLPPKPLLFKYSFTVLIHLLQPYPSPSSPQEHAFINLLSRSFFTSHNSFTTLTFGNKNHPHQKSPGHAKPIIFNRIIITKSYHCVHLLKAPPPTISLKKLNSGS